MPKTSSQKISPHSKAASSRRSTRLQQRNNVKSGRAAKKDVWGDDSICDDALGMVVEWFGGGYQGFVEIVAQEYTKFRVVKSVEKLACSLKDSSLVIKTYQEKCVPTKLVDMFWHAHMLSPQQYADACNMLVGGVINHNQSYISPNRYEGSNYDAKKKALFHLESEFPRKDYFDGRLDRDGNSNMLFVQDFSLNRVGDDVSSAGMNDDSDCG